MFSHNNYPDIMSSLTRGDFALLSGFGKPSQLVCSTVFLTSFFPPRCVSTISISTDLPYWTALPVLGSLTPPYICSKVQRERERERERERDYSYN